MHRARAVLDSIVLLSLPAATFERAADIAPETLRSPDALHLAAALDLDDELHGIVTYDDRLAAAARSRGIRIGAPS
jgi:predicted nucleic acid-binding protein